jgi:hypothetical protein
MADSKLHVCYLESKLIAAAIPSTLPAPEATYA